MASHVNATRQAKEDIPKAALAIKKHFFLYFQGCLGDVFLVLVGCVHAQCHSASWRYDLIKFIIISIRSIAAPRRSGVVMSLECIAGCALFRV